jgi:general secretion pathway protein L
MPEANEAWQWSQGESWQAAVSLEQLIQDLQPFAQQEVTVFFPSRHIQMLQQALNKAQYKQLGQEGIKYLLEEYIVFPIDSMKVLHHFQNPDQLTLLGISQHLVETWQHSLSLLPIKIVALIPDFYAAPQPVNVEQTVLLYLHGRLLARESEWMGCSIDDLSLYLDYQTATHNYVVSNITDVQLNSLQARLTQDQINNFQYTFAPLKKTKQHPFNVLPKLKSDTKLSGYWKACAALFLVILVVQFGFDASRWYKNKKVADETAVQAVSQFKYWFGQNYPVTEQTLKSQFEFQMRNNQMGQNAGLQLLSRVGPVLMQNKIIADRVSYDAGALNLDLKANSSAVLQNLTQQLNQQGFKVELGNIQPNGSGVIGSVKVQ